jgi:hypothetical protein
MTNDSRRSTSRTRVGGGRGRQVCDANQGWSLWSPIGLCSACAQQAGRVYRVTAVRDGASGANVVTASDLASGGEGRTVLAALQQVRPSFWGRHGRLPL